MAAESTNRPPPVSFTRLRSIAQDACDLALQNADSYVHTQTESWNGTIINKILESLVASAETSSAPSGNAQYKYAVTSTIIQHLTEREMSSASGMVDSSTSTATGAAADGAQDKSIRSTNAHPGNSEIRSEPGTAAAAAAGGSAATGSESVKPEKGRRGMHSATGAYWNNETDGMWTYKWDGAEKKGMDVVISVIWVSV